MLVAVKVAFGENVHFDDKKCHGDIAGGHLSVTADNSREVEVLLEFVETKVTLSTTVIHL